MAFFGAASNEDTETDRSVFISNGNVFYVGSSKNPYGLWTISVKDGSVPIALSGSFTSFSKALTAIEMYLSKEKFDVKIVDAPVEKQVIKTKANFTKGKSD